MSERENNPGPELEPHEEKKAEEEQSLSADITYEVIRREAEGELERTPSALAWSGLAAGLAMAFSFVGESVLRAHLPDAEWRPLVAKLGYPIGFLIVTLGSQQLYTENTLMPIVPVLARKTRALVTRTGMLWGIVFVANIVGALVMAYVIGRTTLFDANVHEALAAVAREAVEPGFATILLRGIFAGFLIAAMMWMIPAAEASHVLVIIIMTYLVGVGKLSHVIAGSVASFYLVATGGSSLAHALVGFTLPALIGNTIGGVLLVAALNHAQVAAGKEPAGEKRARVA